MASSRVLRALNNSSKNADGTRGAKKKKIHSEEGRLGQHVVSAVEPRSPEGDSQSWARSVSAVSSASFLCSSSSFRLSRSSN